MYPFPMSSQVHFTLVLDNTPRTLVEESSAVVTDRQACCLHVLNELLMVFDRVLRKLLPHLAFQFIQAFSKA